MDFACFACKPAAATFMQLCYDFRHAVRTCPFLTSVPGPEIPDVFVLRVQGSHESVVSDVMNIGVATLPMQVARASAIEHPGFSRLASAEKPLWCSMTPLLNVSCGPRIFHPTCVDVNMTLGSQRRLGRCWQAALCSFDQLRICFSTYAREMGNTIVHIDTFGGEGTERAHSLLALVPVRCVYLSASRIEET